MQETQVAWDPISEARLPWESKLFVLYLFAVVAFSLVRALQIGGQLWSFRNTPRLPTEDSEFLRALQDAASKFTYAWEICTAKVAGIRRLVSLTLLLSVFLLLYNSANILRGISMEKRVWSAAVAGGLAEMFTLFALGMLVCSWLHAVSSFSAGVLERRKAAWNYFYDRAKNERESS